MTCLCAPHVTEGLRQCPEHFSLWDNGVRLTSVGRIVGMFPQEPCNQCGMPIYSDHVAGCRVKAAIENAKERGSEVDVLFGQYVTGRLSKIPAGTREDVRSLFMKLKVWFDAQNYSSVESQVIVSDGEVGGILDLRVDGMILDLKCTYDVSPTHGIQVGGYVTLEKRDVRGAGILHVTERFAAPRLIPLDVDTITADFAACRKMYEVVARLTKKP